MRIMSTRPLFVQQSTTLDGNGDGTITVNVPAVERWNVNGVTVSAQPNVNEASCYIYKNRVGKSFLVDSTISGSTGDTSDTIHTLYGAESLIAVWSGGTPSATAFITIRGDADNPSNNGGFNAIP